MLLLRPIVVNEEMIVLGGNMRLKACQAAGLTEAPVMDAHDLTDEQQREFIVKDNVGFGEWDFDALANEWDLQQLDEWALDIPNMKGLVDDAAAFNDAGTTAKNQFAVIVMCTDEHQQEETFKRLQEEGFTCKVIVT